jgi:hypothetical protein
MEEMVRYEYTGTSKVLMNINSIGITSLYSASRIQIMKYERQSKSSRKFFNIDGLGHHETLQPAQSVSDHFYVQV